MNDYLIELFNVPHEIMMYVEDLKQYADIRYYSERSPLWIWIESPWEKDILEKINGIKKVRPPMFRHSESKMRDIIFAKGNDYAVYGN